MAIGSYVDGFWVVNADYAHELNEPPLADLHRCMANEAIKYLG